MTTRFEIGAQVALATCAALFADACSGPRAVTASYEPNCPQCEVVAESSTPFTELRDQGDALLVLDAHGSISAVPKATGELNVLVPAGSGAEHLAVTPTSLVWAGAADPNDSSVSQLRVLGVDGSPGPELDTYRGPALVATGLGDAFTAAFSENTSGSHVNRYALDTGASSTPAEALSEEEDSELPLVSGSDAEVVWCRTHADGSSSLWRLGASGDPSREGYPFSCANLWALGNGRVIVQDPSTGMNCYYLVDDAAQSKQLTCTANDYEGFVPLADGSTAFIDQFASVRRITDDGQISSLFDAPDLVGVVDGGDRLYYATFAHVGSVSR